jgi:hypothetical protein
MYFNIQVVECWFVTVDFECREAGKVRRNLLSFIFSVPEKSKEKTLLLASPDNCQDYVHENVSCGDEVDNFAAGKGREFSATAGGKLVCWEGSQ